MTEQHLQPAQPLIAGIMTDGHINYILRTILCLAMRQCMGGCWKLWSADAGDVIYTNMPTRSQDAAVPNVQYFWEAFPSGSGPTDRTTYLFTYIDADPRRCCVCLCPLSTTASGSLSVIDTTALLELHGEGLRPWLEEGCSASGRPLKHCWRSTGTSCQSTRASSWNPWKCSGSCLGSFPPTARCVHDAAAAYITSCC